MPDETRAWKLKVDAEGGAGEDDAKRGGTANGQVPAMSRPARPSPARVMTGDEHRVTGQVWNWRSGKKP